MERSHIGWSFWLQWVIVMTMFLSLSYTGIDMVLRPIVMGFVPDPWAREATIVLGLAVLGAAIGITQRLLLRRHLHRASTWSLALAAAFWVGASLTELASVSGVALLPSFALSFLLLGPVCGLLQRITVRHQVARAGWWVVAQTLGWPVMFAVAAVVAYGTASVLDESVDGSLPMSYASGGAALGATTGAVLVWLLRAHARYVGGYAPRGPAAATRHRSAAQERNPSSKRRRACQQLANLATMHASTRDGASSLYALR